MAKLAKEIEVIVEEPEIEVVIEGVETDSEDENVEDASTELTVPEGGIGGFAMSEEDFAVLEAEEEVVLVDCLHFGDEEDDIVLDQEGANRRLAFGTLRRRWSQQRCKSCERLPGARRRRTPPVRWRYPDGGRS